LRNAREGPGSLFQRKPESAVLSALDQNGFRVPHPMKPDAAPE
jgi:hypothetical protein